jgi:hypothetical protein
MERVLAGGSPYGVGYDVSRPPGSPFVYGPLALVTSPLGVPAEVAAATGMMALLAWTRSWITLAIFSAYHVAVQVGVSGINDHVPGCVLMAGLLALERRAVLGCVLLAVSAAIKPYGLAWFPGAIGYAGIPALVSLIGVTALLWSPLLFWGPLGFLRSTEMAAELHEGRPPENTLNVPAARVIAIPLAIAAFFVRRWSLVVVSGAAIFMTVLFLDRWASHGYFLVVLPLLGIVAERWWRERGSGAEPQAAEAAPVDRAATAAAPSS